MRITNGMMTNTFLRNMNGNVNRVQKYQLQMATGRKIQYLSDDPVGVLKSMTAKVKLYRLDQYQKNIDTARTWLTQAETNMMELNKVLQSAYETAVQVTSDTYSPSDKAATAAYIAQLRDHLLDLGNGQESELYIFSGYTTTNKPFAVDPATGYVTYKGKDMATMLPTDPEADQVVQFEIGHEIYTDAAITGIDFMGVGDDNIYNILQDFYTALIQPDVDFESVEIFIGKIKGTPTTSGAIDRVLAQVSEIGGRLNRLDMMEDRYATDSITYTDMLSKVEDADIAEASMEFSMAYMIYNSALNVGAKILQPSLLDYIS